MYILFIGTYVLCAILIVIISRKETELKQKTECIEQVVDMLRSYNQEPENAIQTKMADIIFSEMIQYLSYKDKQELRQKYDRDR